MKVVFSTDTVRFEAELNDTDTAREIFERLPLSSPVSRWGDEIYFDLGFKASAQNATMDINLGDIAYWSQGKALCIFFGITPASSSEKPEPASPVVIIGKTEADPALLRTIRGGDTISCQPQG